MSRTDAQRLIISALAGLAVAVTGAPAAQAQTALTPAQIQDKAMYVTLRAQRVLGDDLGCVNTPGSSTGSATAIHLYVTKRSALPAARKIARDLGAASVTTVDVVAATWGVKRRRELARRLGERIQAAGWSDDVRVLPGGPDVSGRRCASLGIMVDLGGSAEQRLWAHVQAGHYPGRVSAYERQPGDVVAP